MQPARGAGTASMPANLTSIGPSARALRMNRWSMRTRARVMERPSVRAVALGLVGYRLVVDFGYRVVVATDFDYYGFTSQPTVATMLISWGFLLALLPLLIFVLRSERLSAQISGLLALISLVPTTTLIAHDPRYPALYIVLIFSYWLVFLLASAFMPSVRPFLRPLRSDAPHMMLSAVMCATILFISWFYTGLRLHFGLFDIYDLRAEAREYQIPIILAYVATMADNLLPILLAYYLRRRWLSMAVALGVVILFNYGITATKQIVLLLLFAVISVAVPEPLRLNRRIIIALAVLVSACILEKEVFGTLFAGTLSLFRVMVLPAHMHWFAFDFFQTRELLFLTQSVLRFFFDSPYSENVQFLLGEYQIGIITARANNGLFTDGYMNFGAASVLFYPVLAVFVMKLIEGAATGLSSGVQFTVVVSVSFVFLGLPLPTAILTAGIGGLVILLALLPRQAPARSLPPGPA